MTLMKRLTFIAIMLSALISCTKNEIKEEIISRHEDGSRKETFCYQIEDGEKVYVRETWYYMEGMKHLDGPIENGKRNGKFETYYKSGRLLSSGEFVDGAREGKAAVYYENGNIHYEGNYKNGKECGVWKFYHEDGKLYKEVNRDLR